MGRSNLTCVMTLLVAAGIAHAAPLYTVIISYHVTNVGEAPIESLIVTCLTPTNSAYQHVIEPHVFPTPMETENDPLEQTVNLVELGALAPGQTKAVRVLCWVQPRRNRVRTVPARDAAITLTESERAAYLADAPPLGVEQLREAAKQACGDAASDLTKARAIFDYVCDFDYGMDTSVDAAPDVVARREGSCSELAFAFVGLCRAAGIPARVVTAFKNRGEQTPGSDWRRHRWGEVFIENVGWIPADPTNQINQHPTRPFWGRQEAKYVAFIESSATSALIPRWTPVLAFHKPADAKIETHECGTWRKSRGTRPEREYFDEACAALVQEDAAKRIAALQAWADKGEPLRFTFALEALFDTDPGVRRTAANLLADSDDPTVALPLMERAHEESDADAKTALIDAARKLLAHRSEKFRALALDQLAKSRVEEAIPLAAAMVHDPSKDVRWRLAGVLYKLGDEPSVHAAYADLLADKDEAVRFFAAQRWARLGSWRAAQRLVDYLADRDSEWRRYAHMALKGLTDQDFGFNPRSAPDSAEARKARARWQDWVDRRGEP
jgi:HEAT repeat protein